MFWVIISVGSVFVNDWIFHYQGLEELMELFS